MSEQSQRLQEFTGEITDAQGLELIGLIIQTGRWLQMLLSDEGEVDRIMKDLFRYAAGGDDIPEGYESGSWVTLWEQEGLSQTGHLRPGTQLYELAAFGLFGLPLDLETFEIQDTPENLAAAVEEQVTKYRTLLDSVPQKWLETPAIERTVLAAEARILLDTGRDVTPEQLAAIARVSLKSIRNLLTPKSGSVALRIVEGRIPNGDARRWLSGRPDFKSSIWWEPDLIRGSVNDEPIQQLENVVFVPVANDGSWFDPVTCRNSRGYTIGPGRSEEKVEDYWKALERLARMPRPSWRRPNAAGNWGIVTGTVWERRLVSELEERLDETGDQP
jgi:hypothetical protein